MGIISVIMRCVLQKALEYLVAGRSVRDLVVERTLYCNGDLLVNVLSLCNSVNNYFLLFVKFC